MLKSLPLRDWLGIFAVLHLLHGSSSEFRGFVEPIEGDLPSPCEFESSPMNQFDFSGGPNGNLVNAPQSPPLLQESYPPIDMNPFASGLNPSLFPYYESMMYDNNEGMSMDYEGLPCPYGPSQPQEENNFIYNNDNLDYDEGFELKCDLTVCTRQCQMYLQQDSAIGSCEENICYCKEKDGSNIVTEPPVNENPFSEEKPWTYEDQDEWHISYASCKEGVQSPMNMNSGDIKDLKRKVSFHNFNESVSFFAINSGKGVKMLLQSSKHLIVSLNSFWKNQKQEKNYTLSHLELHWPYEEHSVDNVKSGVLEMQLYFFDSGKYCLYEDAKASEAKGRFPNVMALSLIFGLSNDKTDLDPNIFEALVDLSSSNKVGKSLPSKPYLNFIGHQMNYRFGFYVGTHTTPPCSGGLLWLINHSPSNIYFISTDQLNTLQNMKDSNGERIISNVRNIQK